MHTLRIAAYNVEFSKSATPEKVGQALKPLDLDVITFNEVPAGNWTANVGKELGMKYHFVGNISSGNHKDKYKSILSKTPLRDQEEYKLEGRGWNPAGAVRAVTDVRGIQYSIYSLHISGNAHGGDNKAEGTQAAHLLENVLSKDKSECIIAAGDFNDRMGDKVMDSFLENGYQVMWQGLKTDLEKDKTYNTFTDKSAGVIDHIIYKSKHKGQVEEGGIFKIDPPLSDHHPVWAALKFAVKDEDAK